jgi:hypothetical protein
MKINQNQSIVTKADKGSALVILHKDEYDNKIQEFITNNCTELLVLHNVTSKQQMNIKSSTNNCNNIINQNNKWKYSNMNQKAPYIYGTMKLHKEQKPIRPTVSWKDSQGYKLAYSCHTNYNYHMFTILKIPSVLFIALETCK